MITSAAIIISSAIIASTSHAQTAPPPNLGEETKGAPAIEESASGVDTATETPAANTAVTEDETQTTSTFGTSTVVESRRESGQVYSIELQHSNAPTQYIEETDSDGNIEFQSNDSDETPNLPKWKLGSW